MVPLLVVDRPVGGSRRSPRLLPRALAIARKPEVQAEALATSQPPAWAYVSHRLSPLSSTEIRSRGR